MLKTKILICDDMVMVRALIRRSLSELGYNNLHEASDGFEALEMISKAKEANEPFDVVFMDWNMPGMSGVEVIEKCKKDPSLAQLPFIVVSAEKDHRNIVKALKLGATDYVLKPFSPVVLAAKLSKVCKPKTAA